MTDSTFSPSVPSRSLACGLLVPLLWVLRKPLLGLIALVIRTAMALFMPALLALGIFKAWQMLSEGCESRKDAIYPGDSESLTTTAANVVPPTGVV